MTFRPATVRVPGLHRGGISGTLVGVSRAGAHNVIGALWEVSDASTPRLMDQLYDELKKGRSPEAALRSAKLSLVHSEGVFRNRSTGRRFNFIPVLRKLACLYRRSG